MDKKGSLTSSGAHSTQPYLNTRVSWGVQDELNARGSAVTKSLNLKADARPEHPGSTKHISFQDQDSSSTQSTGQSSTEVASSGDDNPSRQISFSAQSDAGRGFEEPQRKSFANNSKPGPSATGLPDIHFAPTQTNFSFQYADPHYGGLTAASYIPQMWSPHQMMGLVPTRVPLPLDLIENEPVFVNAKQFPAIMRRRQQRAKLEAQNKIIRSRKPYLHESRHVHALKRPRGSGGRFLNTKKLEESKESRHEMSDQRQHTEGTTSSFMAHRAQNGKDRGSTTSGSDTTSVSDGIDIFGHSEFQISESQTNRTIHVHGQSNDMTGGGNNHHFSVHI